jgi:hypothetical protein
VPAAKDADVRGDAHEKNGACPESVVGEVACPFRKVEEGIFVK